MCLVLEVTFLFFCWPVLIFCISEDQHFLRCHGYGESRVPSVWFRDFSPHAHFSSHPDAKQSALDPVCLIFLLSTLPLWEESSDSLPWAWVLIPWSPCWTLLAFGSSTVLRTPLSPRIASLGAACPFRSVSQWLSPPASCQLHGALFSALSLLQGRCTMHSLVLVFWEVLCFFGQDREGLWYKFFRT